MEKSSIFVSGSLILTLCAAGFAAPNASHSQAPRYGAIQGPLPTVKTGRRLITQYPSARRSGQGNRALLQQLAQPADNGQTDPVQAANGIFDGSRIFKQASEPVFAAPSPAHQGLPSDEQIASDLNIGGISNVEREKKAIEQFQKAGANAGEPIYLKEGEAAPLNIYDRVIVQPAGDPNKHNIYVVKKGRNPDLFVVSGGHLDRVDRGSHGIIDNWSGSRMVMHGYEVLKNVETESSIVFINFAREEEGLVGSKFWVKSVSADNKKKLDAMLNLDTHGIDGPILLKNGSTQKLLDLTHGIAKQESIPVSEESINGGDSDHTSFRRIGIPVLMIFSVSEDKVFDIIHGPKDKFGTLKLDSYKTSLRLSLPVLKAMAAKANREPIFALSAQEWARITYPEVQEAARIASSLDEWIAANRNINLVLVQEMITRALPLLDDDDKLLKKFAKTLARVHDMRVAQVRDVAYQHVVAANHYAGDGNYQAAAEEYSRASDIYRQLQELAADAAVMQRRASEEWAKARKHLER